MADFHYFDTMSTTQYPAFNNPSFEGYIGSAKEDITPQVGIYARNWGAARHETAQGIHRPLYLSCVTFQTAPDSAPLVLIGADLGWWKSAQDEKDLRTKILNGLSLDEGSLMFCLSHTHAGPSLFSEDSPKPGGDKITPYLEKIANCAIKAVKTALAGAQKAVLSWQYGRCDLAVNRDLPNEDRLLVAYNPFEKADDTLLVGKITAQNGTIIGTIVNYACHPTTLAWDNQLISPDYIGSMRELVETATDAPCVFLQGASGELSPKQQYVGDTAIADVYGRQLGYAVLSVLEAMLPAGSGLAFTGAVESGAPLGIWERSQMQVSTALSSEMIPVHFDLKPLPSLQEIETEWASCQDSVVKERLWRKRGIRKTVGDGERTAMPLWIFRLGDSFLFGQPNEAYSDFQLKVRQQLGGQIAVACINIVNGYAGYLPPQHLYVKDMYAVWQTPFAPGSLELLTTTAVKAAQSILLHES